MWERVIKSMRRILRSPIFQKVLTDDTLEVSLLEAEEISKNLSLVKLVNDCGDLDVFTPNNSFLVHKCVSFDEPQVRTTFLYNRRWEQD